MVSSQDLQSLERVVLSYYKQDRQFFVDLKDEACSCAQSLDAKRTALLASGTFGACTGAIKATLCGLCGCYTFFTAAAGGLICLGACYAATKLKELSTGVKLSVWAIAGGIGAVLGGIPGAVILGTSAFLGYKATQHSDDLTAVRAELTAFRRERTAVRKENGEMKEELTAVRKENGEMKAELTAVRKENGEMKAELTAVRKENGEMKAELTAVRRDNADLKLDNADLKRDNADLKRDNADLKEKVDKMLTAMNNMQEMLVSMMAQNQQNGGNQ